MTTMAPDWVVGEVGFGSNFAPEADFYRAQVGQLGLRIADLEGELAASKAEAADLRGQLTVVRSALQGCAALTPERATEKHEALLATDPQNANTPPKKSLP